ncbi:hypothetical protein OPQ81_008918 [Rhizoctonia solani]|nr:hypothetical protein OPQ81_008918 [Rhizoctonia solani]
MADSTSSQDNLLHPQSRSEVAIRHFRDPQFYCDHKVVVLLVENTLFKFQASRLAPDPGVKDYEFKNYLKDALDSLGARDNKPGCSDEQPIILPKDIKLGTFRDLLMVSSGGVTNNEFMRIMDAANKSIGGIKPEFIGRL